MTQQGVDPVTWLVVDTEELDNEQGYAPLFTPQAIEIQFACSDNQTGITTGANKGAWPAPFDGKLVGVQFDLTEQAPTGADFVTELRIGEVELLSTPVTVEDGDSSSITAAVQPVISVASFARGNVIRPYFTQVGSTNPGKGVVATLFVTKD